MSYTSGTRTLQTNVAEDLYSIVAAQLGAHPNWTFVEHYTTALYKWSVWRCEALNSIGQPYYVLFVRTIANSSSLYAGVSEGYDVATHSVIRGSAFAQSTPRTPAADGSVQGATPTPLPNAVEIYPQFTTRRVYGDPSAYDYWMAVNNDGMWISTRVGANTPLGISLGTFDSLVENPAVNDPFPLYVGGYDTSNSSYPTGTTTRHPRVSSSVGYLWGVMEWFQSSELRWTYLATSGTVGGAAGDLFQGGKAVGSRLLMRNWSQSRSVPISQAGNNRGLYRHILYFELAAGVTVGDTITIGATTWVYTGRSNTFYEISAA